ncbi:methyltransferase domain-containing protein [Nocardioides donggukensis]|uniref:Methyltransferase domain-containing protein n=1 Tax=Nocardioides donggukensis TaxID=2774019 RepID=A0A927PZP5_9ACTN|nr:methyltransferase domain-containing protein [Nocardioides donggukensis]MBD8870583.1 methyltransferase domain-containing protein [Nocardioides donggukensis]
MTADHDPRQLGRAFRAEAIDEATLQQMVQILDAQDAAPAIRRLRDWALAAAAVRRGERVVDVGCGTGTICRALAGLVGQSGQVVGVDPSALMRGIAEQRAFEGAVRVEFVDGSAGDLPLPDGGTDLVWCERVLQHVDDPQAALVEIARVLRPGGRALVLDADHETRVHSDVDPDVAAAINRSFMGQVANPRSARRVPRLAMTAGLLVDPDVGSSAVVISQEMLLETPLLPMVADQAVADGAVSRAEADAAVAAQHEAARQGWAFASVTVFAFLLRKPEGD